MPGYDTHYLFGVNSYRRLPKSEMKRNIYENKGAYTLGLLRPDIVFDDATEVVATRKNIGSAKSLSALGLFDDLPPNQELKQFLDDFKKLLTDDHQNVINEIEERKVK